MNGRQICVSCGVGVRLPGGRQGMHVGDVGLAAIEPDRRDHAVQQLAGTSDEGQALDILVAAGGFADEHDARLGIAVGKHQPRRGVLQRATLESFQQRAQRFQRRRGSCCFARGGNRGLRRRRYFAARNSRHGGRHFPRRAKRRRLTHRCSSGRDIGFGKPIDRLLRQCAVDSGFQIKSQQLPNIRRGFGDQIHYANLIWIAPA